MFRNIGFGIKLTIRFLIIVLLVVSIGLVSYFNFKHLEQDMGKIVAESWPASAHIKEMRLAAQGHSVAHSELIEGSLTDQLGESDEHVEEHYTLANEIHETAMEKWNSNLKKLQGITLYKKEAEEIIMDMNTLMTLFQKLEAAYRIGNHELAARTMDQYNSFLQEMDASLTNIENIIDQRMDAALTDVNKDIDGAIGVIIILTIIIAILELATVLSIRRMERKKSEEIIRLKDEFVFIAAHEIRTPVTAINGYIEMILDENGKLNKEVKENLLEIKKADKRLLAFVNDLLEVAQAEAGKTKVTVSPQDIHKIIIGSIQELKPLALQKKVSMRYEPMSQLPQILGDPQKIKEILINLMGNAIRYNRVKGNVTVSHEIKDESLITHISDTGIGLSKEEQKHLFKKFWRAKNKVVRQISGTGLGLFITKELIERMNGKIWVKSEEGKGSTFSFQLPISVGR